MMTPATSEAVRPLDCHATVLRLWDYLDEEMDAVRMQEVTAHVDGCRACAEHFTFARSFLSAVATSRPLTRDPELLRHMVESKLRNEGFSRA